ncbi:unnamed protein product [Symbiodinium sp. CCMP2592]|nr:unnamed protein product [Symbiodinium sp. CCMP2592]
MAVGGRQAVTDMVGGDMIPALKWPLALLIVMLAAVVILMDSGCVADCMVEMVVVSISMMVGKGCFATVMSRPPGSPRTAFAYFTVSKVTSGCRSVVAFLRRWLLVPVALRAEPSCSAEHFAKDLPALDAGARRISDLRSLQRDNPQQSFKNALQTGNFVDAEVFFEKISVAGLPRSSWEYAMLVQGWARQGNLEGAQRWLARMVADGYTPPERCYLALISEHCKAGELSSAESLLSELLRPGYPGHAKTVGCTMLIDAYGKLGKCKEAERVMHRMEECRVNASLVSFGAMLDACAKAGLPEKAFQWHTLMLEQGFPPNVKTFTALINAYAKVGDINGALGVMQSMEAVGVLADTVTYSSLLDACAKQGDPECAQQIFEIMRQQGLRPNIVSYTSLARAYALKGMWCEVEHLGDRLEQDGLFVNDFFLYALLLAYSHAWPKQTQRAEASFLRFVQNGKIRINKYIVSGLHRAVGGIRTKELVYKTGARYCTHEFVNLSRSSQRKR